MALCVMLARTTQNTFGTILVLSAEDPVWPIREEYSLSVGPLARTILDILFATIFLFDDLPRRSSQFYKGGWRENWEELERYRSKYDGDANWTEWLAEFRGYLDTAAHLFGLSDAERANPKSLPRWPIPSRMLADKSVSADRRELMSYLYDWFYKGLSAQAHGSLPGLVLRSAALLPQQDQRVRDWRLAKQRSDQALATCLLALSFVSEVEIECHFGLVRRLQYVWTFLSEHFGMAKELYSPWYERRLTAVDA